MCLVLYVGSSKAIASRDVTVNGAVVEMRPVSDTALLAMVDCAYGAAVSTQGGNCCCDFFAPDTIDGQAEADDAEAVAAERKRLDLFSALSVQMQTLADGRPLTLVAVWSGQEASPVHDRGVVSIDDLASVKIDNRVFAPERYRVD